MRTRFGVGCLDGVFKVGHVQGEGAVKKGGACAGNFLPVSQEAHPGGDLGGSAPGFLEKVGECGDGGP